MNAFIYYRDHICCSRIHTPTDPPTHTHTHTQVHIILGIGNFSNLNLIKSGALNEGTMGNVAASPNDPVFINHHTMIDSIFEQWLQQYPNGKYGGPMMEPKFAGHSANDCIVPFIPVYTHMNMFKPAEDFGYTYDFLTSSTTGPTTNATGSFKGMYIYIYTSVSTSYCMHLSNLQFNHTFLFVDL